MRIVSIGDLIADYYYENGILLGVNGGMTSHNIIANLSKIGLNTMVCGACGSDDAGLLAIKSLEDLKVDVSNIKIFDKFNTRCFHVSYFTDESGLSFTSKKKCPICNKKRWYENSLIVPEDVISKLKSDDILVFDNLNDTNQKIIDSTSNKKVIDLGQYFEFENKSNEEILKKVKNKFDIINFNERVSKYLLKRFDLIDAIDIYKLFKPKFMTITRGSNGATFVYNNEMFNFELSKEEKVVDSTGAGDAFLSSIIYDWINNNLEFDSIKFDNWYRNSNKLTAKVVRKMGARGHLTSLYKIMQIDKLCICEKFNLIKRKQIKRCNININNLEKRVINALNSNASEKINIINFSENDNILFVGTGGSFAAAYFSSLIVNRMFGCNTYALSPRDVIYRNNKLINKVILFSYSGTTNDIISSVNEFETSCKYIVTKGEIQKIVLKANIKKDNIISYRTSSNKGKERGFLSFEGSISPSAIFFKYYYDRFEKNFEAELFIKNSINYWHAFFDDLFKNKNIRSLFNKGNLINLFRGDFTNSACYDFESKIIESGIFNCIIHEKKNFSHGRFINYENLDNKFSIYFKQKTTSKYEEKLLEYLDSNYTILIESRYDDILCEFDLLMASQFLIYYIGKILDIDVSKPDYSEDAMKIYFYKGGL